MGSVQEFYLPNKILVGISLDVDVSMELLSWAINVAAHPGDVVVALYVLVVKDEKRKLSKGKNRMRRAKAFAISMLGEFSKPCENKQVKLEARVVQASSVGKGLVQEAADLPAKFLVVGGSRNSSQRTSFAITKYCFAHSPEGCLVIAIGKQSRSLQDSDTESVISQGTTHKSSSRWSKGSTTEEDTSPRTVLDGPEDGTLAIGDCISPLNDENQKCRNSKSRKKILSFGKLFFPTLLPSLHVKRKERDGQYLKTEDEQPSWRCFSYEEISLATNSFHPDNLVGKGGYAEVYKGNIDGGQTIAVKRLTKGSSTDKEKEFLIELGIVGHVCHPNTAFLLGCCIENGLHLIFDYSPNGTLASALHGKTCKLLEWNVRYKIAVGIARGLHYLHKCCRRRIIHRDIKASNVLLGPDYEPQISDFGLAKWLPKQWTHHCVIPIEGTFGYLAPEYFMHGIVDEKTDVFAFGVLLLEIITGRRPVDSSRQSLLLWAKPLIQSGNITELVDPKLRGKYDMDQMQRLVLTASYCTRQSSIWRPSMNEVLQLLTDRQYSKVAEKWSMPENKVDEMDNYYASDADFSMTSTELAMKLI